MCIVGMNRCKGPGQGAEEQQQQQQEEEEVTGMVCQEVDLRDGQ